MPTDDALTSCWTSDVSHGRIVDVSYDGFDDGHVEQLRLPGDVGLPEQLASLRATIPDDVKQWIQ